MSNLKEQILLKHLNNLEIDFIQDNYGNIFNAMDEYAEVSNQNIYELFDKPTIYLKPLEELYRKENQIKRKNGKIIFYTPDRTKFYKWITNKIMNNNNNAHSLRTSQQWWDETKQSEEKIIHWLKNQYHGEAVAAERIRKFILPTMEGKYQFMVERIADDEDRHSKWIGELLLTRGITPKILEKEERYWKAVMTEDFSTNGNYAAAVAAHAEEMRLERIMVIMNDESITSYKMMDIKQTFINIYKDELFHAKGFKLIAGDEYYNQASSNHAKGLEALGLIV